MAESSNLEQEALALNCSICGEKFHSSDKCRKVYREKLTYEPEETAGESALDAFYKCFSPEKIRPPTPGRKLYACPRCFTKIKRFSKVKADIRQLISSEGYFGRRRLFDETKGMGGEHSERDSLDDVVPLLSDRPVMPSTSQSEKKKTKNKSTQTRTLGQPKNVEVGYTIKARLVRSAQQSRYTAMLNHLSKSRKGRSSLMSYIQNTAAQEMMSLCSVKRNSDSKFRDRGDLAQRILGGFSWDGIITEVKEKCPHLFAALEGAVLRQNKGPEKVKLSLCSIFSQLGFMNNRHMDFVPKLNSLNLRLNGCHREVFTELNHMSVCQGYVATQKICETLAETNKLKIESWKGSLEKMYADPSVNRADIMGYTVTFDNINVRMLASHDAIGKDGMVKYNMVHAYAARDRIPCMTLSEEEPDATDIRGIPTGKLLPDLEDLETLRSEFTIVVKRILTENFAIFRDIKVDPIRHEFSDQSAVKSEMVGLGVLNFDEKTEIIKILEDYHQYCPTAPNGSPTKLVLFGDQLSCERVVDDGQKPRLSALDRLSQLQGLYASAQERHCGVVTCPKWLNDHYKEQSVTEFGTLVQIRNFANHVQAGSSAKRDYKKDFDLLELATNTYVCLFALQITGMASMETEYPNPNPELFLHELATEITAMVTDDITYRYRQDIVNSGDNHNQKLFCICRQPDDKINPMIMCSKCEELFHHECVHLNDAVSDNPDEDWFCNMCTKKLDNVYEYSKSMTYHGLLQLSIRDAIRYNDGPRMMMHWRHLLYSQFASRNSKYQVEAIRLLCAVNGAVSERLKHQLLWSRTVNYTGGDGRNKAADLRMEDMSRTFEDSLRAIGVKKLSETTLRRQGGLIGVSREVRQVFEELSDTDLHGSTRQKHFSVFHDDVVKVVNILSPKNLVSYKEEGRHHPSFKDFRHGIEPKNPKRLGRRIREIREDIASDVQLLL